MDTHDFTFDPTDEEAHKALLNYFRTSPGRGSYEPRKPEPHHIDTAHQPEDKPDYGMWSTLGGVLTPFCAVGFILAVLIVKYT